MEEIALMEAITGCCVVRALTLFYCNLVRLTR